MAFSWFAFTGQGEQPEKTDSIETRNEEGLLTDGTTFGENSERDNTREQHARKDPLARILHVPRAVLNLYNQDQTKCCFCCYSKYQVMVN